MNIENQLRVAHAEREEWRSRAVEMRKQLNKAIEALDTAHSALDEERAELAKVITALRNGDA